MAPIAKIFLWSDTGFALIAIVLGFFFGFLLEKVGFASSSRLAGQWYGYDFAIFRFMFSAVLVALVGVYILSSIGFLNMDKVWINPTYIGSHIVGGIMMGLGWVISNQCATTSTVACATGKLDGLAFVGGFFIGVNIFTFAFPWIENFYRSGDMGRYTLADALSLPTGLVVFLVVLTGLAGFVLTHWLDKKLKNS